MTTRNIYFIFAFALLSLMACQDVITVDLEQGEPQVVVDAWINNLSTEQSIILQYTQPYFDSTSLAAIEDATVQVISSAGKTVDFTHTGQGVYTWTPATGEIIGDIGEEFDLMIITNETTYSSSTELRPVPVIDSIQQEFRTDEFIAEDGIYTQFFSRDLVGLGDTYWIKTYKDGVYLNKPLELNIAYDASRAPGAEVDNVIFIPPIREGINEIGDENLPVAWEVGQSVRVEIHSISNDAYTFLALAQRQILNGLNTIFAEPLVNTDGNIESSDGTEVLGFFNVAAVSISEKVIE